MLPLSALGVLTVVAYGTWFYGFGVLFTDLASFHGVSASTLGVTFGIANLISGVGAVATGRRLDMFGPGAVLGVIGPLGAIIYCASSFTTGEMFLATYALGGGLIGAAGFYSFTQPLVVRVSKTDAARAITRLTIWGAFSSPIMIPLTEILRSNYSWQTAVRLPAMLTFVSFLFAAVVCRVDPLKKATQSTLVASLCGALGNVRIKLFAIAEFFSAVAVSTLLVYQVPTMTWAGVSTAMAASLASGRGLMQLAGRIPLLSAINRFTATRLIVVARMLLGISAMCLLVSGNLVMALIYIVLAGVTIGALSALDGVVAREIVQPEVFGTVMGGIGLVATLGGSFGPILSGWLRDRFDTTVAPMLVVFFAAAVSTTFFTYCNSSRLTIKATQDYATPPEK